MRPFLAVVALLAMLAYPAFAQAPQPSDRIIAMRDQFEAEFLAVEKTTGSDPEALTRAAAAISERIYGADWSVVRAESWRSIAALPVMDLSPYERRDAKTPFAEDGAMLSEFRQMGSASRLAMMRFYDAQTVASFAVTTAATTVTPLDQFAMSPRRLSLFFALAPARFWRAQFKGREVLVGRYLRSLVVVPYGFTPEGLILPDLAGVLVYPSPLQ
jgi:hypothetical protein